MPEGVSSVGASGHPLIVVVLPWRDAAMSVGGFSQAPLPIFGCTPGAEIPDSTKKGSGMFTPWC